MTFQFPNDAFEKKPKPRKNKLLSILQHNGLTLADVAVQSGTTRQNVHQFINGHHSSKKVGQSIYDLVGLPIESLTGYRARY